MGLAPLHTWLPDAHSEAPSPVSGLLSGALLNCAFLAILRVHHILVLAGLGEFSRDLLVFFGLLSMGVAAVFILGQIDFKRMLAYSSIEHMGILALGAGIGGVAGFGCLLHAVNHSFTKGMLFLTVGNILAVYKTKSTEQVQGVLRILPITGILWFAGFLAICGSPPFGPFLSELTILKGAFDAGHPLAALGFLAALAVIFVGFSLIAIRMAYSDTAADRTPERSRAALVDPSAGVPRRHGAGAGRLHSAGRNAPDRAGGCMRRSPLMSADTFLHVYNGRAFAVSECPPLPIAAFRRGVIRRLTSGATLAALCGRPYGDGQTQLLAVLARPDEGDLAIASTIVTDEYPALTAECPQAHWFEREIAEQYRVRPAGHPWLKPIRFPSTRGLSQFRAPCEAWSDENGTVPFGTAADTVVCGTTDFFRMEGLEIHEVAVGPVHAGIIEPGHFRFQCHGETVFHLEISLGYQHRGVERAMVNGNGKRTIHYMETLAGDTTIGHATAYCRLAESLSQTRVPVRGQFLRGIAAELERVANHVGDLGRWPATWDPARRCPIAAESAATS